MVALDGLLSDAERAALLRWLTDEDWQQGSSPPASKWERNCVDYGVDSEEGGDGDGGGAATWGLQQHVVQVRVQGFGFRKGVVQVHM